MIEIELSHEQIVLNPTRLKKSLRQAGKMIADQARKLILASSGGPGNAPKSRTGNLAKNMKIKVKGTSVFVTDTAQTTEAQGNAFYSLILEAGAKASQRRGGKDKRGHTINRSWSIAPRPFLSTALNMVAPNLTDDIGKSIMDDIDMKDVR